MRRRLLLVMVGLGCSLAGCDGGEEPAEDAGADAVEETDATVDSGEPDAGDQVDTGEPTDASDGGDGADTREEDAGDTRDGTDMDADGADTRADVLDTSGMMDTMEGDTGDTADTADAAQKPSLTIESSAFTDGGTLPTKYTCQGQSISPPLMWSGVPAQTKSFVLLLADPDAPGRVFKHWAAFDIPAGTTSLSEGVPAMAQTNGFMQGLNDFSTLGYGAPCPPTTTPHRYQFRLWALDVASLNLTGTPTYDQVKSAAQPHTVGKAMLTGKYGR